MPIISSGVKYIDVPAASIVRYDPPSLSAINPSDCVDFPCDAQKKALIIDTDGTLTLSGEPSTVIPDVSFQWDGDRSYGTGYYRVPKPMVTNLDGSPIPYADLMPNIGIHQDASKVRRYIYTIINHNITTIFS